MDNQTQTQTKQPIATRIIEKFKQKTLLEKIVSVVVTVISLTILFTIITFILQVAKITSIVKSIVYIFSLILEFITGTA